MTTSSARLGSPLGSSPASWARLTEDGIETVACVGASHTKRLRSLFRDSLSEDEVEQLSDLLGKLPGVGAGSCAG